VAQERAHDVHLSVAGGAIAAAVLDFLKNGRAGRQRKARTPIFLGNQGRQVACLRQRGHKLTWITALSILSSPIFSREPLTQLPHLIADVRVIQHVIQLTTPMGADRRSPSILSNNEIVAGERDGSNEPLILSAMIWRSCPQNGGTLELRHLQAFLTVSEAGSFSKAAATLRVAQPVLSRQIKTLEKELHSQLFLRTGRGVVLTDAGRLLASHAEIAVRAVGRASDELMALRNTPTGSVTIGVPPTVGAILTRPLVHQFRKEYPKISLTVVEGFSGFVLEWLSVGRLDAAVIYNAPKTSTLLTERLCDEELYLLGPPSDPSRLGRGTVVRGSVLARLPLVLPSQRHGLRMLVDTMLSQHQLSPRVEVEIDSLQAIVALVEDGLGYTILPYAPVQPLIAAKRLCLWPIDSPKMSRQLALATSMSRTMAPATRVLIRIVREIIQNLIASRLWTPDRVENSHLANQDLPSSQRPHSQRAAAKSIEPRRRESAD